MTAARILKAATDGTWPWFHILMALVASGLFYAALILPPKERNPAACDDAVAKLFAATDLVTLERSKFLIEELRCSVARRLPGDA